MMNIKSEEFKTAMSVVREKIAVAKQRGTHKGFIDYNGCLSICHEFMDILEAAGKAVERGECAYAYSVTALILINCAKLAGSADDSSGGVTDTRSWVEEVLEKISSKVEHGSAEAEFIFRQSLKDSRNKIFNEWEEFAYDLLLAAAKLATTKNVNHLYTVLDELSERLSQKAYASWHMESDRLVRLAAITASDGDEAAARFIASNLKYDSILRVAILKAIENEKYIEGEKLCLGKISSMDRDYYWTQEWYELLFDIYIKMDNKGKQADLAADLLIYKHDTQYYDVLKNLLREKGVWEIEYPLLLEQLEQNLPYRLYSHILDEEGEMERLLNLVSVHSSSVFDYVKQLSMKFPKETYGICLAEIRKQADQADNRMKYRHICSNIGSLFSYGGVTETYDIIEELQGKYPRRSAMLDELNQLLARLKKKQA
jgi:hypothetical protein